MHIFNVVVYHLCLVYVIHAKQKQLSIFGDINNFIESKTLFLVADKKTALYTIYTRKYNVPYIA